MKNPIILVFGRLGQIGWCLQRTLACCGSVLALDYPEVDFTKPDSIVAPLRQVRPAIVINAAAYTSVDKAETQPEVAMAINGTAPAIIAEESKRLGSIFVHYSTEYVFDGTKQEKYLETDSPNPLNVYGRTKLAGDLGVQASTDDYLIFRTSWVYGVRARNFLLTVLRLAEERTELRIVCDQTGSPSSSEMIAQATATILGRMLPAGGVRWSASGGCSGIYNLVNSGETTWFGFAESLLTGLAERTGSQIPRLMPIPSSEYPLPAARPSNSRLSTSKIEETFGVRLPHWEQSLSLVLDELAERRIDCRTTRRDKMKQRKND